MKKIWNWIIAALGVVFAFVVYTFFNWRDNSFIKEKVKEVKTQAKVEEEKVKKIEKKIENRREEAKTLADRLKNKFNVFLIILIVFCFSFGAVATNTIENLKIPSTYDELLVEYKDMADIAIGYQKLYNEAESDNQALMEVVKNLQSLLKTQQDIIDELLKKNRFGLFGGLNVVPFHPDYSGIMAGVTFEF